MLSSSEAAAAVLGLAETRPATLGHGQLISVDGPAGAGKTTLAAAIAADVPGCQVVHMDDLFPGWGGLPEVGGQLESLLRPLAAGQPGSYRRYDWHAGRFAETVTVPPGPLLVLEGVGSGLAAYDHLRTVLVWVTAPHDLRMRRGIARDGDAFAPHWEQWAAAEADHFTADRTEERADLVVDGSG